MTTSTIASLLLSAFVLACHLNESYSFSTAARRSTTLTLRPSQPSHQSAAQRSSVVVRSGATDEDFDYYDDGHDDSDPSLIDNCDRRGAHQTRRSVLQQVGIIASTTIAATTANINAVANAALGTLPEFSDANAILQSLTIDVTDKSQYDETISFFTNAFEGMKVLRQRGSKAAGGVKETWLGFGPETLSIPPSFTIPVSSLSQYGGHASLHIRYDPSSTAPLYKRSSGEINNEPARGDNIAYLQIGVPMYRISQMVKNGGNVLDAYGWVNVISPAGLPVRGIVGVRADPMMFLAVNCEDVGKSEEFYSKLGFVRQVRTGAVCAMCF